MKKKHKIKLLNITKKSNRVKTNLKRIVLLGFIIAIFICPFFNNFTTQNSFSSNAVSVESAASNNSYDDIQQEVEDQLGEFNFDSIDKIISQFNSKQAALFGDNNFLSKIIKLISGDFDDSGSLWKNLLNVFLENILNIIPIISLIIAIALLGNMLQGLKPSSNGKSMTNIIQFVTYGFIVILIMSIVTKMIASTTNTLLSVQAQMDAIFPILLTLLTAIGGSISVSVYQPAMAMIAGIILNLFTHLLLPIFIFSIVFSIVSNLSGTIKLNKFTDFFTSTFKWLTGLIFTIFTAFISIQGITAGSIDGVGIKTAKYAIRSYVPMLGSYISDGMGLMLVSSNLIKNAVGAAGLFMLLATILSPIIQMVIFILALKLIAGIVEPLGNKQISNLISSISKSMVLLIVLLIGVSFVYFILIGLVMCSANIL